MFVLFILLNIVLGNPQIEHTYGRTEGGIVINEGTLTIHGTLIDPEWKHSSFTNVLGEVERDYSGVDIYDTKGIMLWNQNNNTEVTEFKAVFTLGTTYTPDWYCRTTYPEVAVIEGMTINGDTGLDELLIALPQYNFSKSGTGWYDGVYKDIYIFAQFDESLEKLVYLAIGLDEGDNYK